MSKARASERLIDLPNLLSLSRIPLAAVPWLAPTSLELLLACMVVAGLTDWLDGLAARRAAGGTPLSSTGAWLDPLCDKVFVASAAVLVVATHPVPLWLLPVVLARDLLQAALFAVYLGSRLRRWIRYDYTAGKLGKATTVAQFLVIAAIAADLTTWVVPLAWVACALGVAAAGDYGRRALDALRHPVRPDR